MKSCNLCWHTMLSICFMLFLYYDLCSKISKQTEKHRNTLPKIHIYIYHYIPISVFSNFLFEKTMGQNLSFCCVFLFIFCFFNPIALVLPKDVNTANISKSTSQKKNLLAFVPHLSGLEWFRYFKWFSFKAVRFRAFWIFWLLPILVHQLKYCKVYKCA